MKEIKNIIFDLGDVLVNIDENLSIEAFSKIFKPEINFSREWEHLPTVIHSFETGKWSKKEFFSFMKKFMRPGVDKRQIEDAWCAMLLDFPVHRLKIVNELKSKYNLYLLSNTDPLHINIFETEFQYRYGYSFKSLFKQAYYSSDIGCRKPSQEPFLHVLNHAKLDPEETVFIDDKEENCEAASKLSMHTIVVPKKTGVEAVIDQLNTML